MGASAFTSGKAGFLSCAGSEQPGLLFTLICLLSEIVCIIQTVCLGTSLAVQWLGLHASNAGGHGFDPWLGELRSHMLHGKAKKKKNIVCPFRKCMVGAGVKFIVTGKGTDSNILTKHSLYFL